jgi:rhodanese-related sulfurtransferase
MGIFIILGIMTLIFIYKRYVPVFGISPVPEIIKSEDLVLLDLRDYQSTSKDSIPNAINIPYAYLKRYYREIPSKRILVVATDMIEKNLAIRFLRKRKFVIHGFIIFNDKGSEKRWSMTSTQKTG